MTGAADPRRSRRAATTPAPRSSPATARSARTSSPRRASTTATAASCPRSPRATTWSSSTPSSTTRCARAGATLDDVDLVAVTQGPGLVGALLVGVATAKGLAAARGLPLAPVDHLQGHVAANFLRPRAPFEPPFLCLIASRRPHLPGARRGPRRLHGPRPHARRRRGRGVRQGRAPARAAVSRAARALERLAAEGDPRGLRLPDRRRRRRPGLLLRRPEDRAALQGPRPGRGGGRRAPRRPRRRLPARDRRGARAARRARRCEQTGLRAAGVGGGVAANGPLRERMARPRRRAARPAARAVHRQRGDDRPRRALRRRRCRPRLPGARRLRDAGSAAL